MHIIGSSPALKAFTFSGIASLGKNSGHISVYSSLSMHSNVSGQACLMRALLATDAQGTHTCVCRVAGRSVLRGGGYSQPMGCCSPMQMCEVPQCCSLGDLLRRACALVIADLAGLRVTSCECQNLSSSTHRRSQTSWQTCIRHDSLEQHIREKQSFSCTLWSDMTKLPVSTASLEGWKYGTGTFTESQAGASSFSFSRTLSMEAYRNDNSRIPLSCSKQSIHGNPALVAQISIETLQSSVIRLSEQQKGRKDFLKGKLERSAGAWTDLVRCVRLIQRWRGRPRLSEAQA